MNAPLDSLCPIGHSNDVRYGMPLYVKLDINRAGWVHAWVRANDVDSWGTSVAWAPSAPGVLRKLAKAIPLPKVTEKKETTE